MRFVLRLSVSTLALVSAVSGASATPADDGPPITVTATRIAQPVSDVPATVTVKTSEQIADELASDVRDLVRFEPGVSVRRAPSRFGAAFGATGRGGAEGFNIRGIEGNRVLVQVDGIRVPDGFSFGAQSAGRGDYVDLGIVKSLEILRGPTSALYGSDGLAGAVSFTTNDPVDLLEGGKTAFVGRAAYDSVDDEFSESLIASGAVGALSALVAYTRRDGAELKNQGANTAPNATRTAPNPQRTASNAILGKLVWQPDTANRLRLTVDHLDARVRTTVLSAITAPPVPPAVLSATAVLGLTARDTTDRNRVSLDWRYTGSGWLDQLQVSAWWQDGRNRQTSAEDRNTALDRTRINTFENRVLGASAEARSRFTTGSIEHTLIYGADISVTRQKGLRDGTVPTPPDVFPTRAFPVTDFTLAGAFVADNIVLAGGAVALYPALRFDHYRIAPRADPLLPAFFTATSQSGSRLSPKIGIVVKPFGGISAFFNYARGFKSPSPNEVNQFFDNPGGVPFAYRTLRNPGLRPETSESIEGGLRLSGDGISLSTTAYSGRYRDFIAQLQVGGTGTVADPVLFQYINLARVRIRGIEGRLEGRTKAGFTGSVAIAYADGDQFDQAGVRSPLVTVDPLKLVAGVGYRATRDRFGGQITATYHARKEEESANGLCIPACLRPDSATIVDATMFLKIAAFATVRAGVFNIFDEKYALWSDVRGVATTSSVADAFTQPGRNASVSLSLRF